MIGTPAAGSQRTEFDYLIGAEPDADAAAPSQTGLRAGA